MKNFFYHLVILSFLLLFIPFTDASVYQSGVKIPVYVQCSMTGSPPSPSATDNVTIVHDKSGQIIINNSRMTAVSNGLFYINVTFNSPSPHTIYSYCKDGVDTIITQETVEVTLTGESLSEPRAILYGVSIFFGVIMFYFFLHLYVTIPPVDRKKIIEYDSDKGGMSQFILDFIKKYTHRFLFLFLFMTLTLIMFAGWGMTLEFNMEVPTMIFSIFSILLLVMFLPYFFFLVIRFIDDLIKDTREAFDMSKFGGIGQDGR